MRRAQCRSQGLRYGIGRVYVEVLCFELVVIVNVARINFHVGHQSSGYALGQQERLVITCPGVTINRDAFQACTFEKEHVRLGS